MFTIGHYLAFVLIALVMVITPGPNMAYLVSRSIGQGRRAGLLSLLGIGFGFVVYMLCATLGLTAIILAVPLAYDALRLAGAAYLVFLAWQAVRPGGRSPFEVSNLPPDGPRKLFAMGLLTSLLNPKVAMFYVSVIPQFIQPEEGGVLAQSLILGATQIAVSMSINTLIVFGAGSIAVFLGTRPRWAVAQRWIMASVLSAFAVRMALDGKR